MPEKCLRSHPTEEEGIAEIEHLIPDYFRFIVGNPEVGRKPASGRPQQIETTGVEPFSRKKNTRREPVCGPKEAMEALFGDERWFRVTDSSWAELNGSGVYIQ